MTTKPIYDSTGVAITLSNHIHHVASGILATIGIAAKSPVLRRALASRIEDDATLPFNLPVSRISPETSVSAEVALSDAQSYYARLREACASSTSDELFVATVKQIALSMVERDHAQRVAEKLESGEAAKGFLATATETLNLDKAAFDRHAKAQRSAAKRAPAKARRAARTTAAAKPKAKARAR